MRALQCLLYTSVISVIVSVTVNLNNTVTYLGFGEVIDLSTQVLDLGLYLVLFLLNSSHKTTTLSVPRKSNWYLRIVNIYTNAVTDEVCELADFLARMPGCCLQTMELSLQQIFTLCPLAIRPTVLQNYFCYCTGAVFQEITYPLGLAWHWPEIFLRMDSLSWRMVGHPLRDHILSKLRTT